MAGDWIKMRTNLDTDVRIIEIATELQITELHVIGCLWKLWSWADQHTHDGNAIRVTCVTLDRFTGVTGFADALRKVGWLEGRDGALCFPRFAEHNGQTAKNRAETKERVAKHRNAKCVTDVTQKPLPEKRREEKRRSTLSHSPEREKIPPDFENDKAFCDAWLLWHQHRSQLGKPLGSIEAETQLSDLMRFDVTEATQVVLFSISRGARNLVTNGDHNQDRGGGRSSGRRTKTLDEVVLK